MIIMGIWIDNQAGQGGNGGGETPKEVSWNDIQGKPSSFTPSPHEHKIGDIKELQHQLGTKVDKEPNKQLSTNDFTDEYKTKIDANSVETEAVKESLGNMKGIIISSEEPAELYEGLIWIKPLGKG